MCMGAWHAPLVVLCACVPLTAAQLAPTAVDVCDAAAQAPGCGGVLGFDAARASTSDFCQMQLRAPPGQVVRLAFTAVDLGTAFVSIFDGASQEEELVQLTAMDTLGRGVTSTQQGMLLTVQAPDVAHAGFTATVSCVDAGVASGGH